MPYQRKDAILAGLLALAVAGCGARGPQRAAVEGTVTRGGQPVPYGRIVFIPQPPAQGPVASAIVVDGRFQLDRREGPVVGPNRVEVQIERPLGFALDDEAAYARARGRVQPAIVPVASSDQRIVEIRPGTVNRCELSLPGVGTGAEASR